MRAGDSSEWTSDSWKNTEEFLFQILELCEDGSQPQSKENGEAMVALSQLDPNQPVSMIAIDVILVFLGAFLMWVIFLTRERLRAWIQSLHGRAIFVAALALVISLSGLLVLETLHNPASRPWWHHLLLHLFALLGSVGAVGLIFELILKVSLFDEFRTELRSLFHIDQTVAESLSPAIRQQLVLHTLITHLGRKEGEAIYNAVVHRYFSERPFFREGYVYEVTLDDLEDDRALTCDNGSVILSKAQYFELRVTCRFTRAFVSHQRAIGCILSDGDLMAWFQKRECLFREIIYLDDDDQAQLHALLTRSPDSVGSIAKQLCTLRVLLNYHSIPIRNTFLSPSRTSIEFDLAVPEHSHSSPLVHEIHLSTIISKAVRKYPIHLVDPTLNPKFVISYPARDITRVSQATFMHSQSPFEPNVEADTVERRVIIMALAGEQDPM